MPRSTDEQCSTLADGGRCQLQAGHLGAHARQTDFAYMTWSGLGLAYRWSVNLPPDWLLALAWAAPFQPAARAATAVQVSTAT